MSEVIYLSPFGIGHRVVFIGDTDLVMTVSAVTWRREAPEVQVTWVHAGDIKSCWLSPDLLTLAPEHLCRKG